MKKFLSLSLLVLSAQTVFAQLPKISLNDINGKVVETDTLSNGGRPFIIDFFATWCKPCNRELDAIHEVYADWQEETGVKIYAVFYGIPFDDFIDPVEVFGMIVRPYYNQPRLAELLPQRLKVLKTFDTWCRVNAPSMDQHNLALQSFRRKFRPRAPVVLLQAAPLDRSCRRHCEQNRRYDNYTCYVHLVMKLT